MTLRKKAKQAPAKRGRKSAKSGISAKALMKIIEAQSAEINRLLAEMQKEQEEEEIEISDLFRLQIMVNTISQITEMNMSVISAMNQTIAAMVRNIK
jgi:uncharacterized protein YqiB (DUF1249 family)